MTERYPDIEIYLKDPDIDQLTAWLATHFPSVTSSVPANNDNDRIIFTLDANTSALFVPRVVKGRFASLWFKQNNTPWSTDEACAREAFDVLGIEVRCAVPYDPEEAEEDERWLRLASTGESTVRWRTS